MEIPEGFELVTPPPTGQGGIATTFGYNDREDNGIGAWGDRTDNPDIVGVSLNRRTLRNHFGDENLAHGAMVEVVNPTTGKSIIAPIVDKGPADWVVDRQGPTIDLTHAANALIGGSGKTPVNFRIIGHSKTGIPDGFEPVDGQAVAGPVIPEGFELVEMGGGDEDFQSSKPAQSDLPLANSKIADDLGLKSRIDPLSLERIDKVQAFRLPEKAKPVDELPNPFVEFGARVTRGTDTATRGAIGASYDMVSDATRQFRNDEFGKSDQTLKADEQKLIDESNQLLAKNLEDYDPSPYSTPKQQAIDARLSKIADALKGKPESFLGSLSRASEELAQGWDENQKQAAEKYEPFIAKARDTQWGMKLADSIGQSLPGTVAAIANPAFGLSVMYAQTYDSARQEYADSMRQQGLPIDPDKMGQYAHDQAVGQTPWELAGEVKLAGALKTIFKAIPDKAVEGGAESFGKWVNKAINENAEAIAGEALITTPAQSLTQDFTAEQYGVQDKTTLSDKMAKIPGQMALAVAQAGIMGGGPTLVAAGLKGRELAKAPKEKPQTFSNLADIPPIAEPEAVTEPATVAPVEPVPTVKESLPVDPPTAPVESANDDADFQALVEQARREIESTEQDDNADLMEEEAAVEEDPTPSEEETVDPIEDALKFDAPIEDHRLSARMAVAMAEKAEAGSVDLSIAQDVVDYGKRIYRKGIDFLDWSMQMVKDLGKGIQSALRKIWDSITGGNMLPHARNRGSVMNPFAAQAEATLAPIKKSPDIRLEIYAKSKERLAAVTEKINSQKASIKNIGTTDDSATVESRLVAVEQKINEGLASLDEQEAAEIEGIGAENLASFMDRIEAAKTQEARAALKRDAAAMARAKTQGARKTFQEKRKALEARGRMERAAVIAAGSAKASQKDAVAMVRADIKGGLAQLEAITSFLPAAVRGKIGGTVRMATLKTDEARQKYLEDRMQVVAKELDKALVGEYVDRIERLLDKAQPKRAENRTMRSKIGSQAQADVAFISQVAELDADELAARLAAIESEINSSTDPKLLADALNRWALAERFGNLVERSPEELAGAWKTLADTVRGGRENWKTQEEARIDGNKAKVETALKELGRPYASMGNELRKAQESDNALVRMMRDVIEGSLAWYQDLQETFGTKSKTADDFERTVRLSTGKFEDGQITVRDRFRADMKRIFGLRSEAGLHDALAKMNKPRNTGAEFLEGRMVKTIRIPIDRALDAIAGKGEAYGFNRQELIDIQGLLDDAAENPRKRVLVYQQVVNPGSPVTQTMSELEAINYLLSWGQADVRAKMESQGIMPDSIKALERFVSPQGHKVKDWLRERYAAEYARMNEVYRRLFGMDMPQIENYAPTFYDVANADKSTSGPFGADGNMSGMTPGFVKNRVNHGELMRSTNALEAYFRHAIQSEYWMAFAETNRELRSVLGNSKVLRTVRGVYGVKMEEKFKQWLDMFDKNGVNKAAIYPAMTQFINRMMGATALTALGGKIGVLMKQTSAATGMLLEVPAPQAALSISRFLTGRLSTSISDVWNTPTIQRRISLGASPAVRAVMNRGGVTPGKLLVLAEAGMAPISYVDAAFTSFSAAVAFDYHYRKAMAEGRGDAGSRQIAADMMDQTVRRTAQPVSLGDRSQIESSGIPEVKLIMMFKSEARQKFAISYLAAKRIARGEDKWMNAQRFAVAWMLAGLITQAMGDLYRYFFKEDDETSWADYGRAMLLGNLNGLFLVGDIFSNAINFATGGRVFQNSATPAHDAIKAIYSKRTNPANWRDSMDAIEGVKRLTQSTANLTGSAGLGALTIPQNTLSDAIGLGRRMGIIEPEKKRR